MKQQNQRSVPKGRNWLADTPLPGNPLTEIVDNNRVLIEHHKGIAAYDTHEIRVNVRGGSNCIQGNHLELCCISSEKIVITGQIECVRFIREV